MWSKWAGLMIAVALLALGGAARADEGAAGGETAACEHAKLGTQDATPLDPGCWEIDFAYALERSHRAFDNSWGQTGRPTLREREFSTSIQYGLVPDVAIGIAVGHANVADRGEEHLRAGGVTDLGLFAKWRFYNDEAAGLSMAYVPALTLPTGSRRVSDGFASLYNGVALTKDWTDRLTSDFDLGYSFPFGGPRDGYRGTLSADVALGYHVTQWLQPEVELNYGHDFVRSGDSDLLAVTAGLIVCANDHLRLGVGVQQGIAGRNADKSTALLTSLAIMF